MQDEKGVVARGACIGAGFRESLGKKDVKWRIMDITQGG
ncbi:hypothetical protein Z945_2006 [Sulfitobacter noctilucae]|nr:hypothetical protein Z945_2006 [Sulfitobacter noctilucae]